MGDAYAALPDVVRQAYDLDELYVAEDELGVFHWLLRRATAWYYGDVLGQVFMDLVDASWVVIYTPSTTPDSWWA